MPVGRSLNVVCVLLLQDLSTSVVSSIRLTAVEANGLFVREVPPSSSFSLLVCALKLLLEAYSEFLVRPLIFNSSASDRNSFRSF